HSISQDGDHPWRGRFGFYARPDSEPTAFGLFMPEANFFWNSAFPSGQNDGAVWQGRGLTTQLTGGAFVRHGVLTASFRPSLIYTQNREVDLAVRDPARSVFANPWHPLRGSTPRIDMPQRFGDSVFTTLDLGETSVRLDWRGAVISASNETMWWGPGARNAIVMSNNAPGFPHLFIGTGRPVDIKVGKVEVLWMWGKLTESEYFDLVDDNDTRFITGVVFNFEPKPLPGFYVGATRVFMIDIPAGGLDLGDYVLVLQGLTKSSQATADNPLGDDERDQLISLFVRWLLPESGFEVYVEWARNDHNADVRDVLLEPGHSEAYTVGFQKVVVLADGRYARLRGELTHLERAKTTILRATPTYYVHDIVRQGYTQRGQVLGAGIGPGSNSQFLGGDVFTGRGRVGGFFRRHVIDNDALFAIVGPTQNFSIHDVAFTFGASAEVFAGEFAISASLEYTRELNRYYDSGNDVTNIGSRFAIRWDLPR
ncbi:MAG: hypothetical protein IIA27_13335, partial [Gemmatimonadetes bacterium]|nr:hypothetical protein [Gemmatimonadota bacterium]